MPPLPGTNTTPKGYYRVGFDTGTTVSNIQTQAQNLLSAVGTSGGNALDEDFDLMQSWFGSSVNLSRFMPIFIHLGAPINGGATWGPDLNSTGVLITASSNIWFERYLVVSEMTEVFMRDQGVGWFAGSTKPGQNADSGGNEGDNGEGLSRFLAREFLLNNGRLPSVECPGFTVGNQWLISNPRQNWITGSNEPVVDINSTPRSDFGCTTLFISYLKSQLGFNAAQIVQHGAPNLKGVFKNLTGDDHDPYPTFRSLIDFRFPGASINKNTDTEDDPFPIAEILFRHGKSEFGKDEVALLISQSGGTAVYKGQLYLELHGFSRNLMDLQPPILSGDVQTFSGAPIVSFNASIPADLGYQNPNNVFIPQLIEYPLDISFTAASLNAFPISTPGGGGGFGDIPVITEQLTAALPEKGLGTGATLSATTELSFAKAEDPYFINVTDITPPGSLPTTTDLNPFYFSQDLRVITITPDLLTPGLPAIRGSSAHAAPPHFEASNANTVGAYQFCTKLIKYMNAEYADPTKVDPFDEASEVLPSQFWVYSEDASVAPYTYGAGVRWPNFNFALARVRINAPAGKQASNVRVFFRAWGSQTADTQWDPNITYQSIKDAAGLPIFPLASSDLHTVPFFATSNSPDSTDPNNPEYGPSGTGINTQTMQTDGFASDSRWYYFGCFLNFFDPTVKFNRVGTHHCLVAEIACADTPLAISNGVAPSPENSDKLAQRNLCVTFAENPGPATKLVAQPFDLKPSTPPGSGLAPVQTTRPDLLRIEWGDTPPDSTSQIYWPAINAEDVMSMCNLYFGMAPLTMIDQHIVSLKTTSTFSLVPIPPNTGNNYAGLITVDLPMSITDGQKFIIALKRISTGQRAAPPRIAILHEATTESSAAAHPPSALRPVATAPASAAATSQPTACLSFPLPPITGPAPPTLEPGAYTWDFEAGVWALTIPVTKAENIVHFELDNLAISKYRASQMAQTDRWYPVLKRYIGILEGRVDGLTGTAGFGVSVPPGADGAPVNVHWPGGGYGGGQGGGQGGGYGGGYGAPGSGGQGGYVDSNIGPGPTSGYVRGSGYGH